MTTRPLDPTARDFDALLAQLRQRVKQRFAPVQTDLSEAGLLGMLLDLFAAVGDGLHFQLDNALQELFWDTVRDRDAAARLAALVGYRPKGATAAVVTLRFCRPVETKLLDETAADNPAQQQPPRSLIYGPLITIPARTPVATADGDIVFETLEPAQLLPEQQHIDVAAEHAHWQEEIADNSGQPNQLFVPQYSPCVEGQIELNVQGKAWQQVEDFLASGPTDTHYRLQLDTQGGTHVQVGDGLHGCIPAGTVRLHYRTGGGRQGNVAAGCLTQLEQAVYDSSGQIAAVTVTNLHAASGGSEPESVAQIRRQALLQLRSQQRAVTEQDIVQHAQAVPGVGRVKLLTRLHDAAVPPHAGFLYITAAHAAADAPPADGKKQSEAQRPAADTALLQRVQQRFAQQVPVPVGFVLHVVPAGLVAVDLAWRVWLQQGAALTAVQQAVRQALQRWLSPNSQQPWGQLPHTSQLIHQVHQAHAAIQGVQLLTDLSRIHLKPHQLPVLGTCSVTAADKPI